MEYRKIPGFPKYTINRRGDVRSLVRGIILKLRNYNNYHGVVLYKNNISHVRLVHRLVLLTFKGKSKLDVNHKNCIKTDNRLTNLEYCTKFENMRHAMANNLIDYSKICGERHGMNKLTAEQVIEIKYFEEGYQKDIAKKYSVSQVLISRIRLNKVWKFL